MKDLFDIIENIHRKLPVPIKWVTQTATDTTDYHILYTVKNLRNDTYSWIKIIGFVAKTLFVLWFTIPVNTFSAMLGPNQWPPPGQNLASNSQHLNLTSDMPTTKYTKPSHSPNWSYERQFK